MVVSLTLIVYLRVNDSASLNDIHFRKIVILRAMSTSVIRLQNLFLIKCFIKFDFYLRQKVEGYLYNENSTVQKSLDQALFLYIFIREIRSSGVRASITIVHIRKFYEMQQSIARLRFSFSIAKRHGGGGGFFHSKGTWGCAARKGMLFQTFLPSQGYTFCQFYPFSLGKGILFGNFGQRNVKLRQFL